MKVQAKELLKAFPFCHQKKVDRLSMKFFSSTTQVCSKCLYPLFQDEHALTGFFLLGGWGGSTPISWNFSHYPLHQEKSTQLESPFKGFIHRLNNSFDVIYNPIKTWFLAVVIIHVPFLFELHTLCSHRSW